MKIKQVMVLVEVSQFSSRQSDSALNVSRSYALSLSWIQSFIIIINRPYQSDDWLEKRNMMIIMMHTCPNTVLVQLLNVFDFRRCSLLFFSTGFLLCLHVWLCCVCVRSEEQENWRRRRKEEEKWMLLYLTAICYMSYSYHWPLSKEPVRPTNY